MEFVMNSPANFSPTSLWLLIRWQIPFLSLQSFLLDTTWRPDEEMPNEKNYFTAKTNFQVQSRWSAHQTRVDRQQKQVLLEDPLTNACNSRLIVSSTVVLGGSESRWIKKWKNMLDAQSCVGVKCCSASVSSFAINSNIVCRFWVCAQNINSENIIFSSVYCFSVRSLLLLTCTYSEGLHSRIAYAGTSTKEKKRKNCSCFYSRLLSRSAIVVDVNWIFMLTHSDSIGVWTRSRQVETNVGGFLREIN